MICSKYGFKNLESLFDAIRDDEFPFEEPNAMDNWMQYGMVKKDVLNNQELKVLDLKGTDGITFNLFCEGSVTIPCQIKKEKKFFEMLGVNYNVKELTEWLNTDDAKDWFQNENVFLTATVENGMVHGSLSRSPADNYKMRMEFFKEIREPENKIYTARIIGKNSGGFLVDIDGIQAFLPGGQASANKITDFDSYIGKKIPVMLENYEKVGDSFSVSKKKYIEYILPTKIKELNYTTKYIGEITGIKSYGIFIEFNDIFTGLLHVSEMSDVTKELYLSNDENFTIGNKIEFYIKEIIENNGIRIILSERENIEKLVNIEDFKIGCEKTFQDGEIINIKQIGSFIRFLYKDESFIGLLHYMSIPETFEPKLGMKLKLWIIRVDVESKKIFLSWDMPENEINGV